MIEKSYNYNLVNAFCIENEHISEKVAIVFLKGINKTFASEIT